MLQELGITDEDLTVEVTLRTVVYDGEGQPLLIVEEMVERKRLPDAAYHLSAVGAATLSPPSPLENSADRYCERTLLRSSCR